MAQIDLNLGTAANSNDGDSLRAAMQTIQTNTTEIYAKGVTPLYATLADLPSATDHHGMFAHVHATGKAYFAHNGNWVALANEGSSGSSNLQEITATSGTINLNVSLYSVFRITSNLTGATTLNIQNMESGQVIDITVSGSQTITFTSDDTSETFNKVGGVDYDGTADNHIQVVCIDQSDSAAIYNYAIGTFTSDSTP